MREVTALALAVLVVAAGAGVGLAAMSVHNGRSTCDHGFRTQDWRDRSESGTKQIRTGRAIARCDWLDGWSRARVTKALGRPDARSGRSSTWILGDKPDALGPTLWELRLKFDRHGRVTSSDAITRPY
ncbi:MAG TPA: hypothetical protein VK501_10830 [Baekduia sp.]|uniref:hypothetical protein n=1 Tax=Baekduia sp. TaxID=2600305 RepID=UPI002D0C2F65|nr:hypothetical protein [Baekduia sp.]HMJ34400.1 hypothetical protein [Baekduia sp.]